MNCITRFTGIIIQEKDIQGIPSHKASPQTVEEAATIKKNLEQLIEKKT